MASAHGRGRCLLNASILLLTLPAVSLAITTFGDPADYVAGPGTTFGGVNLDGVVSLSIVTPGVGTVGCSGALLYTGMHVLTAAHCVDGTVTADGITVNFDALGGAFSLTGSAIFLAPGWAGGLLDGNDLAVIALTNPATGVVGYNLYTGASAVSSTVVVAGFGTSGTGDTGVTLGFGTRRVGQNIYDADATHAAFGGSANILVGDFDNGMTANDAFGSLAPSIPQLGVGTNEVMLAPGDSGGPSFLGGLLVGVHSFRGIVFPVALPDVDDNLNSSFGEVFGDTSVAAYATWIEAVSTPEPGTFLLLGAGLAALGLRKRRAARR